MQSPSSKVFKDRALKFRMLAESEPGRADSYRELEAAYERLAVQTELEEELAKKRDAKEVTAQNTDAPVLSTVEVTTQPFGLLPPWKRQREPG
jgi:hypothetical protein